MPDGHGLVFPGWHPVTNLKWRPAKAPRLGPGAEPFLQAYESRLEGLLAMRGWAPKLGWHLSLSHATRNPTWEEIHDARYDLLPDGVTVGILLPPKREYVNLHQHCFHLHQVPDDA